MQEQKVIRELKKFNREDLAVMLKEFEANGGIVQKFQDTHLTPGEFVILAHATCLLQIYNIFNKQGGQAERDRLVA